MKRSRRTEIRVETLEVSIQSAPGRPSAFCPVCAIPLPLLSLSEAAILLHVGVDIVRRWLAEGQLHGPPGAGLGPLVCAGALTRLTRGPDRETP